MEARSSTTTSTASTASRAKLTGEPGSTGWTPRRTCFVPVSPDELQTIQTSSTPHFLGLDDKGGLWDQLGGVSKGRNTQQGARRGTRSSARHRLGAPGRKASRSSDRKSSTGSNGEQLHRTRSPASPAPARPGEQWAASNCNTKAHLRALLQRRGRGGNARIDSPAVRGSLHVATRLQRPRHAHVVDRRRSHRRPADR